MEKRYQVFVSSTYEDLKEERSKVITALLDLGHIPCGMEYFPAADEDAWNCIERLIPQCDYYVVLIAGKYGSIAPGDTKSYTHKEYELAVASQIPVLGLLHRDPTNLPNRLCETDPRLRKKLDQFRTLVRRRLCRFWTSSDQIPGELLASLTHQINRIPRVGWVRADSVASDEAKTEIIKLRRALEKNEKQLEQLRKKESDEESQLASGDEEFLIRGCFTDTNQSWLFEGDEHRLKNEVDFLLISTWNQFLRFLAIDGVKRWRNELIHKWLAEEALALVGVHSKFKEVKSWDDIIVGISDEEIRKINVQLNALGLSSSRDDYWMLTPKGVTRCNFQLALRKGEVDPNVKSKSRLSRVPSSPFRAIPLKPLEGWMF